MEKISKLCIATHNQGKLKEIALLFDQFIEEHNYQEIELCSAVQFGVSAPAEDGNSFIENAAIKARFLAQRTSLPVIADDSGLSIYALGGLPGLRSAELAEQFALSSSQMQDIAGRDYAAAAEHLLKQLAKRGAVKKSDRLAKFQTVICFVNQQGEIHCFNGTIYGFITETPRGENGFGYDSIFQPLGEDKSFAEMTTQYKTQLPTSRTIAMQKLLKYLSISGYLTVKTDN